MRFKKMKNTKWILLSLIMVFIGVPILAHCVALFSGVCVAIIAYILEALGLGKETQGLSSALILLAVCNLMFFGGRIWSKDNAPEDNLIWRHVILLLPVLLALLGWIYALQQAGLDFYTMGSGTLAVLSPWAGIHIVNLVCQWYWGSLLIPVCSQLSFTLGYGWSFRRSFFTSRAGICRSIILFLIVLASAYAAYQAWQQKLKYPNVIYEDFDTHNYRPDKWHNELTTEQVRDIFSVKMTNWRQVVGPDAAIEPWQRPEDSGSQTAMLAKVMKGTPMLKPREM